jgi:beta-lactamase class D
MKTLLSVSAILLVAVIAAPVHAEDPDLANIFKGRNLEGTIVISSLDGRKTYVHNDARASTRFVPASTFKIPNTLIALEEAAIVNGTEILRWDGQDKGMPTWNQDQSIETAFPSSCVWFYQELAKRVGLSKYKTYLQRIHYGNEKVGPELTTFWLQGDLRISAFEQVEFLRKLFLQQLPFKFTSYALLKKIMVIERTAFYTLSGKTGWATMSDSPVGWIVGYVQAGKEVWLFATNIVMPKIEDARFRKEITVEALKTKSII